MMSTYERADIIHIMKMNRFALIDLDTANLTFSGRVKEKDFNVGILVVENDPQVIIRQNKSVILNQTVKSVDDLKIFLEERLYQSLN